MAEHARADIEFAEATSAEDWFTNGIDSHPPNHDRLPDPDHHNEARRFKKRHSQMMALGIQLERIFY